MWTLDELQKKFNEGETTRWIIKDLIPKGEIVMLYAPTNQYKTFLSVKIALEIVTGSQELGATENGHVVMINTDTNLLDLFMRVKALHQIKYPKFDISDDLYINDGFIEGEVSEIKFDLTNDYYIYEPKVKHSDRAGNIFYQPCKISWRDRIDYWREFDDTKLVIIDTLSQSIGQNSINDDSAIRKAISNLKEMIKGSNGETSILVIAHASLKNPSKGIMGSSIQHNDFPTILKVKKNKNGYSLYREKIKSSAEGSSIPFKMRPTSINGFETMYVDIGKDITGMEADIIRLYEVNPIKDEVKKETYDLYKENYATFKSFNVCFNRYWKNLVKEGFINE